MKTLLFTLLVLSGTALSAQIALKADFERNTGYLYSKGGVVKAVPAADAKSGKRVLSFKAGTREAVLTSGTMMSSQFASPVVRLTFYARGKGVISPGLSDGIYLGKGKYKYKSYDSKEKITLTGEWQKISYEKDFKGTAPVGVYVRIRLSAGAAAEIDDLLLETIEDKSVKISAVSPGSILKAGSPLPVCQFNTTPGNAKLTKLFIAPDRSFSEQSPARTVLGLYRAAATVRGKTAEILFSVLPPEQYDATVQAAQKIKFREKTRILILGDSIHDRNRGRNTADKLQFWFNKFQPGKVEIRNAAVSGDYITLIESRLNGKARKHEVKKYANLFNKPYQLIFIAVGSNDNRTWRKDDYKKPLVPFAEQTAAMTRVIKFLKERNPGARIILHSPVAAHESYQNKRAANAAKRNQPYVKFGDPEMTRLGIAAQKKAAKAAGAEYLDFYENMRKNCDAAFFARNDVIHLDEKGFSYLTQKILEYLADKQ